MSRPRLKPLWPARTQNRHEAEQLRLQLEAARLELRGLVLIKLSGTVAFPEAA